MNDKCRQLLEETSRTFYIPIMRMPENLKDAVAAAYLCLRAIDEIEDHPELDKKSKIKLLEETSSIFRSTDRHNYPARFKSLFHPFLDALPEVTVEIDEFALLSPSDVGANIYEITADMAAAMSSWVERDWRIECKADLDSYTFDVAGRVGLLLSDLWKWHDGTDCDEDLAIGFGRTLQAVNIVRNSEEDKVRGIDFFPPEWDQQDMIDYARKQMELADQYMASLPPGPIHEFCFIPLELARATLTAIENGAEKLNREDVIGIIAALELNMEN